MSICKEPCGTVLALQPDATVLKACSLDPKLLSPSPLSLEIYGDPASDSEALRASIQHHGILVPLVVTKGEENNEWSILSGHRRWASALALSLQHVPCQIVETNSTFIQHQLILEYNRHRKKSFSQLMREADVFENLLKERARYRRLANLKSNSGSKKNVAQPNLAAERRNSDTQASSFERATNTTTSLPGRGRTDLIIARHLAMGGKDLYRQARAIWEKACQGDIRAQASVALIDVGQKTIHAAYKDLRRRTQFITDFKPTPYDVWAFRHNQAFGVPHPGSTPPAIVAHTLYYYSPIGGLVVDPMAGGGTVVDVCEAMGRRCLAYDLAPVRSDIRSHDVRAGFPEEAKNCDLIFCDPPYYSMLVDPYPANGVSSITLQDWFLFLRDLCHHAMTILRPGGVFALLLAPQTEKSMPLGHRYLDHTFFGYLAGTHIGFIPERRISCPMSGGYLPQQVRQARRENRLLGQVRDLLILRKPEHSDSTNAPADPYQQSLVSLLSSVGS